MIRKLITYYKPHINLFILDMSAAFMAAGLDLVFPFLVRHSLNEILPQNDMRTFSIIIGVMMVLYIVKYFLNYIVNYYGHVMGTRMEYDMRKDLFDHIQKLSFTYFDSTKKGHIMSRLVNDLNEISELAHHGPEDLFIASVTLIGSFIIMANINLKLAFATFALVPLLVFFSFKKNIKMKKAFKEMRSKIADVNAKAEDSISGIRVVKAFANEDYEKEKFDTGNMNFRITREDAFKVMAEFFSGIELFTSFINLFVLGYGGYLYFMGELTAGDIIGFLLYVGIFLQPVRRFSTLIENFQKGMSGFERFAETLAIKPDIEDKKDAIEIGKLEGEVELHNVTFAYEQDNAVISNLNLRIKKGEQIALIGPSGVGKTTLLSLIPRFYETTSGFITIDGIDIKNMTMSSLRNNIGIVQQDVFMFSGNVKENIAYGKRDATDEEIIAAAKKANAHEFIMELEDGYDTYIGEKGVKLSGGQKQRLSIARIFLKNPPILILDEATSALDNESERVIQKSLKELSKDRTTLVIAHRLSTVRSSDRILVLTQNGIEEEGNHEELIAKNGLYSKLYNMQFEDYNINEFMA